MKWFKNLKIQTKLFLASVILTTLVVMLALFAISTINSMEKRYADLIKGPQNRVLYISDAVRELSNIRRYILFMGYSAGDTETVETYFARYEASAGLFMECMDAYCGNLENDAFLSEEVKTVRAQDAVEILGRFSTDYIDNVNGIYRASMAKDKDLANALVAEMIPLGDEIIEKLDLLRALVQENENQIILEAQNYAKNSKTAVIVFSVFMSLMVLFVSAVISRAVHDPIVNMESAMEKIAKGDLTYPIRSAYSDELGMLSNRIGDMVDQISEMNKTMAAMDYIDDMISITDLDYNLVYINRKMAEVFGVSQENFAGRKCYEYIKGLDAPCPVCKIQEFIDSGEAFPSGDYGFMWDGRLGIWATGKAAVIRWIDGSKVYFSMVHDDTLKKEHEEQQERHEKELRHALLAAEDASRAKSHFLANMSHEIRTPMNSIIGFSELAMGERISPKTRDYFTKITQSSKSLLQIINDILDISKIESGKIELEYIPFSLHEVFTLCQAAVKPKAMEKDIALYCYAEPSIGKQLVGDPTRLYQALLNILSNAVKFTNTGVIKLLSSIKNLSENRVSVYFEVKDSGIGMSEEQIQRVFDPFMQADISTTRRYGGTGLGLSITKNIIELMGSTLKVESAPGIGSKFSFELEFETVDVSGSAMGGSADGGATERPTFQGEVLICEDNAMNQQVLCEHLARVGLVTVVASNGKEGVAIVSHRMETGEKPFDLILMDIHMPVMDGLEAASKLGGMNCPTPIVAITANIMSNDRETYRAHGMPDCVAKPFSSQELWSCLLKYFTPVKMETVSTTERADAEERLHQQLRADFVKGNQNTFKDICDALESGDVKLAHRLAHTLKGTAGLVGRIDLQEAAFDLERMLAIAMQNLEPSFGHKQPSHAESVERVVSGDSPLVSGESLQECMKTLELELNRALAELAPLLEQTQTAHTEDMDAAEIGELFQKLEPLLKAGNPACLDLVDELRKIPGTSVMIEQMEDFDFRPAFETLEGIKRELEVPI